MWEAVRRELTRLHWDAEPPLTQDLMADWTQTVHTLMAIRRAMGPVPDDDPVALLATATLGAARVPEVRPLVAPSLQGVDAALADMARGVGARPDDVDRQGETATLNQVAYEFAHWVRVQTPDDQARAWLQAGETALDNAIHAPAARSTMSAGLAAWQEALAAVQPVHDAPIVRRSVALGHLMLLREAKAMITHAQDAGMLPQPYADAVLANIGELARSHLATLARIDGRRLGSSRVDQAVMLRVGVAVRQLTIRPDIAEPATGRLAALLRSSVGESVLVANLTQDASAKPVAGALNRLALEYLANPGILRREEPPRAPAIDAPLGRRPASLLEAPATAAPAIPGEPSIRPGTVLDGDTILNLCRARDLGVAAAAGDATNPPEILRGIDPSRWPQLVVDGKQAVTDLVASVIPMVYAQTRRAPNAADMRGQMFVELMGAANRFDPQRILPEHWPKYAWMTLQHSRWRGVDDSGVVRKRLRGPRPTTVALDGVEPASRAPGPGDRIEERESIAAITKAVGRLPPSLREPLLESMHGHPVRRVAEDFGFSESTARRRISEARDHIRDALRGDAADGLWVSLETVIDPVLERSQRMFEATFAPSPGPDADRGPRR
jgi:DNA-directed RNA polymerase specialized sigma24 family protein